MLYKLFISLRCMNESLTVGCVSTGSRRCVYKSFSLSRFKVCSLKIDPVRKAHFIGKRDPKIELIRPLWRPGAKIKIKPGTTS